MQEKNKKYGNLEVNVSDKIQVDGEIEFTLTYTVGSLGLAKGGSLKIIFPPYRHQETREYVQVIDYWRPGFAWAVCSEEDIKLNLEVKKVQTAFSHIKNWPDSSRILKISTSKPLKEGQKIIVSYGGVDKPWVNGASPSTRVGILSTKRRNTYLKYYVYVDIEGNKNYIPLEGFPPIQILPKSAKKVIINAPSIVKSNEEFEIKISFRDRYNNPIFDKQLDNKSLLIKNLHDGSIISAVEKSSPFSFKANIKKEGPYEIFSQDNDLKVEKAVLFCSNSLPKIFWGDPHAHSNLTPNIRDNDPGVEPSDCYDYAKNVEYLDFIALIEQTFEFDENDLVNITSETWRKMGELADHYYDSEVFATFTGFELHDRRGDTVVLFKDSLKNIPYPLNKIKRIQDVWETFKNRNFLTIPHLHRYSGGTIEKDDQDTKYGGFNFDNWKQDNPEVERLVEVFSSGWGRFEHNSHSMLLKARSNVEGNTVVDFLNKRKIWGFTASSDDHDGRPGYGGVTGVFARKCTREEIFSGLHERKSIATTHPRIILLFKINSYFLGNVVYFSKSFEEKREIEITALAPKTIKQVEIIKNGEIISSKNYSTSQYLEAKYEDSEPIKENTYYYVRLLQDDGHIAWASPIWFLKK
ncbi:MULTISPECIES: DUF3604 domain-containing protein [Petrotoga]|uniref:Uncharacterized protein DUF3604 n=2 Tax=Petrotoga sibirica TaxID=156202 RepID=A0A4R8ET44_9BACT|nr:MULTISPECIES: DUF3604 domain-containing protein [Petrotoga]POZ89376.1 hypothetical protein AA80_00815 [Petrotoga sibirica DSM 13575]POZ91737.1 hypothetical protein AD60_00820 [Petrotoga sp. SL27]TDX15479.1 uncharacterized protein DUF3604 [Petrotoga sibirica]